MMTDVLYSSKNTLLARVEERLFDPVATWICKDGFGIGFVKLLGICVAMTVGLEGGDALSNRQHAREYQDVLTALDKNPSYVFISTEDEKKRGFTDWQCKASESSAFTWAQEEATELRYDNLEQCYLVHGRNYNLVQQGGETKYVPVVVGWETAANDATKAVPLYGSDRPDFAVRADGKYFPLPTLDSK